MPSQVFKTVSYLQLTLPILKLHSSEKKTQVETFVHGIKCNTSILSKIQIHT